MHFINVLGSELLLVMAHSGLTVEHVSRIAGLFMGFLCFKDISRAAHMIFEVCTFGFRLFIGLVFGHFSGCTGRGWLFLH